MHKHGMRGSEYEALRHKLKLSQSGLARELDVHHMTVSKRERGETVISVEGAMALRYLYLSTKYDLGDVF
jgi:DNA-binding transcriptional regulator YiaG